MFTAHALRSEKLGIMALCWRHDAFANVVTVPGPLLLLGPAQEYVSPAPGTRASITQRKEGEAVCETLCGAKIYYKVCDIQ